MSSVGYLRNELLQKELVITLKFIIQFLQSWVDVYFYFYGICMCKKHYRPKLSCPSQSATIERFIYPALTSVCPVTL